MSTPKPFEPQRFVPRPRIVEAVRLENSAQAKRVAAWCGALLIFQGREGGKVAYLNIGNIRPDIGWNDPKRNAHYGNWIVRDARCVVSVYTDDEFRETYEAASEG
jgi:hypothetical protein